MFRLPSNFFISRRRPVPPSEAGFLATPDCATLPHAIVWNTWRSPLSLSQQRGHFLNNYNFEKPGISMCCYFKHRSVVIATVRKYRIECKINKQPLFPRAKFGMSFRTSARSTGRDTAVWSRTSGITHVKRDRERRRDKNFRRSRRGKAFHGREQIGHDH